MCQSLWGLRIFFPGKLPSWTKLNQACDCKRDKWIPIPELLLCILSCFSNSFKQLHYKHNQNSSLFSVRKSIFNNLNSMTSHQGWIPLPYQQLIQTNLQVGNHIWFLSQWKDALKPPQSVRHLLYHVEDKLWDHSLYKPGVDISSLTECALSSVKGFSFLLTTVKLAAIGSGFYLFLWRLFEVGCIKKNSQKSSHLWFSTKDKSFKGYFRKPPKNCFLDCQFYIKLKNDLFLVILKSTHYAAEVSII